MGYKLNESMKECIYKTYGSLVCTRIENALREATNEGPVVKIQIDANYEDRVHILSLAKFKFLVEKEVIALEQIKYNTWYKYNEIPFVLEQLMGHHIVFVDEDNNIIASLVTEVDTSDDSVLLNDGWHFFTSYEKYMVLDL